MAESAAASTSAPIPPPSTAILPVRTSRACSECARRKTKCDHQIPCTACIKRGQASLCLAPAKRRESPSLSHPSSAQSIDHRRAAALSELALFRNTLDTLKSRLPGLEWFIANQDGAGGIGTAKEEEMEEVVRRFGRNGPENGDERGAGVEMKVEWREERIQDTEDDEGGRMKKRVRLNDQDGATNGSRERTDSVGGGDTSAAVDAAVDLEYATLGRSRTTFPTSQDRLPSPSESPQDQSIHSGGNALASILISPSLPTSPITTYPDGQILSRVAPTMEQEDVILRTAIEQIGWHHRVFHAPTLYSQISAFWDLGDPKYVVTSPAWLALYFALLAIGCKLLGTEEMKSLGWEEEETAAMASKWFECCVSNLYRQNFLEHHDIHALQAIAVLALSGRDAGSPSLIANLLSAGLSIAQDMGLHKMPSDASFKSASSALPIGLKSKLLIEREIKKRVFWALVLTDWFSIPFRSSWVLGKVQIATEEPLNISDEDLSLGEVVSRDANIYTNTSWLLQYIDVGRNMCEALEGAQLHTEASYQKFLKIDEHLSRIVDNPPRWLTKSQTGESYEFMRSAFLIAVHHKILCIHRPYLYKPYKGSVVEFSRKRVIASARSILREAPTVGNNRIWTVLYHLSAAAFIVMAELFDRKSPDLEGMRREVVAALPVMERLRKSSLIANRGLALVTPLLVEEERMRAEEDGQRLRMMQDQPQPQPQASTSLSLPQHQPPPQQHQNVPQSPYLPLTSPYAHPTPTGYDFSNSGTPQAGSGATSFLPNWFYELGIENGEQWLHSQLSGIPGLDGGDGWGGV